VVGLCGGRGLRRSEIESGRHHVVRRVSTRSQSSTPNRNFAYGILTTGFVAVDIDPEHGGDLWLEENKDRLPDTWRFKTGGDGWHIIYRAPQGQHVSNQVGKFAPGVDIRGDGGQIVGPGSIHPNGNQYTIEAGPDDVDLAEAPQWLIELIDRPRANEHDRAADDLKPGPITEGRRDHTLTRICGHLCKVHGEEKVREELQRINNERCQPPLPSDEVDRIVTSIAAREVNQPKNGGPEPPDKAASAEDAINELNESYWLVREGGRVVNRCGNSRPRPGMRTNGR